MDSDTFDRLARCVGARLHRRGVLLSVIGALGTMALGRPRTARSQEVCSTECLEDQDCINGACVRVCENDRDCRSKRDDPCILNQCLDGICIEAIVDCIPGFECCEGSCCPKSCALDLDCAVLDPCRWGRCGEGGLCEFEVIDPCLICASDLDCAHESLNTLCCGGSCQRPCPAGTVMGKGCECRADGSAALNGPIVRDDASG